MKITRDEFVLQYIKYVKKIAQHYYQCTSDERIEFDDLCQVGYLALMEGYDKYNENRSSTTTYAHMTVKYKILRYIINNRGVTYIPHNLQVISTLLSRRRAEFYTTYGRRMTEQEMMSYLKNECNCDYKVSLKFIKLLLVLEKYHKNSHKYSIEEMVGNYDILSLGYLEESEFLYMDDIVKDDYILEDSVIMKNEVDEILSYVQNNFDEIDVDIFKETFGLIDDIPKTRKELAKKYNLSHQAIDQRYKKVLGKVKRNFNVFE